MATESGRTVLHSGLVMVRVLLIGVVSLSILVSPGCASSGQRRLSAPPSSGSVPLGLQMVRSEASMRKYPFRTLLDFELPTDTVFVRLEGASARLDQTTSHTGATSVALDVGTTALSVRLASLTSGTSFPGRWTLIGAYLMAEQPQRLTASYDIDGAPVVSTSVEIPAGQWTPVLLDLSALAEAGVDASRIGMLTFSFTEPLASPLHLDNVVVLDNTQLVVDGGATSYSVKERGFAYLVERPNVFKVTLKTPEATVTGWRLEEANAIRSRFGSPGGPVKTWLLYGDGRLFKDGQHEVLGNDARTKQMFSLQHQHPAELSIVGELGRVNRTTPGDENNDGYSEATGAYQLAAGGPRLEVIVAPRTPNLLRPIFEIAGLPEGKVVATMEGRLVEKTARLEDGRVLVELPGALDRATTVNVRVTQETASRGD